MFPTFRVATPTAENGRVEKKETLQGQGIIRVHMNVVPLSTNNEHKWRYRDSSESILFFTVSVPSATRHNIHLYGLVTKCEVKMAWYWPSSFFLRVYGPRLS